MTNEVKEKFLSTVQNHEMTVLLDNGVHRHLRFKQADRSEFWFDIVTYPYHLVISGDMGCSVFSRLDDMFQFFRNSELKINKGYWAEKCKANHGEIEGFSEEKLKELVKDIFESHFSEYQDVKNIEEHKAEVWSQIEEDILDCSETTEEAIRNMDSFSQECELFDVEPFQFSDTFAYVNLIQDYNYRFVWRLYAIAWAVQQYDKTKGVKND